MPEKRKPRDPAWLPVEYTSETVVALQALARGEADAGMQQRALAWIVYAASGMNELSFRSDGEGGERETAFAEGRRFVGMQIQKMVQYPAASMAALRNKETKNHER